MTRAEFQADYPQYAASTYNARIDSALALSLNVISTSRAGDRFREVQGYWVADRLATDDLVASVGAGFASAASSSTEKKVGDLSIKTTVSTSSASQTGAGGSYGFTIHGRRFQDWQRTAGIGNLWV
jgi:hypothetical protein